jgi:hypothetical protein
MVIARPSARRACSVAAFGAALILPLAGCQSGHWRESYQFPATWPGSEPLGEDSPTVSVAPLAVTVNQPITLPEGEPGVPTAAVLSVLFVKHLHVNGINAILEKPEEGTAQYGLTCQVPRLGYGVKDQFPTGRLYRAELTCTLRDGQTQETLWTKRLTQDYEQMVVLDLMTNLPEEPHKHDRVLFRECIVPLWDSMASSVRAVMVSRMAASQRRATDQQPASVTRTE